MYYNIKCVTKVFCIYRKLFGNRSQRTVSLTLLLENLNIQKWHACLIIMDVREETSAKNLYFHKESD